MDALGDDHKSSFAKSVGHVRHVWRILKMSDEELLDRQTKCPAKLLYLRAIFSVKWLMKTQNVWQRMPASSEKMTIEGQKVFANPDKLSGEGSTKFLK